MGCTDCWPEGEFEKTRFVLVHNSLFYKKRIIRPSSPGELVDSMFFFIAFKKEEVYSLC